MKRKFLSLGLVLVLMAAVFTGCAKKEAPVNENDSAETSAETSKDLKDGSYLVKMPVSDHGNYPMATLEVKDGQVAGFSYNEYLADSGEEKNESNYKYPEGLAVIKDLNEQFNEKKDLSQVDFDAVSGATHTKESFKEVVAALIDKAAKGEEYTPAFKDGEYEAKAAEASHGWLAQAKVVVKEGQIVGVDYAEIAVEDMDGVKTGDRKSAENYTYEESFNVINAVQKLVIDNNGSESLSLDGITGATNTRTTMVDLVSQALNTAK
ncbi:FMN-binding protein [Tissierella sp. MSJ-40]|uniref:FMN-binding protein n=1 Tax=Tissierella simiarum TaxID=2841534 RepID=A0ABS6EAR6_9FIRM|nr:FMN-binding protein [Tissierella simiarum]MBU5440023.1 FMN-binding protein [Tissierella simiarum]